MSIITKYPYRKNVARCCSASYNTFGLLEIDMVLQFVPEADPSNLIIDVDNDLNIG